jgi:hypothetical protein
MDILEYVRQFCTDLQLAKKTKYQYGVLAFDLGEVGPNPHPPDFKPVTVVDDRVEAAGPSGPWIVQSRNWSPVGTLVAKDGSYALDRRGTIGPKPTAAVRRFARSGGCSAASRAT